MYVYRSQLECQLSSDRDADRGRESLRPHWTNHLCKSILESRPVIRRYKKVQNCPDQMIENTIDRKRNRCR